MERVIKMYLTEHQKQELIKSIAYKNLSEFEIEEIIDNIVNEGERELPINLKENDLIKISKGDFIIIEKVYGHHKNHDYIQTGYKYRFKGSNKSFYIRRNEMKNKMKGGYLHIHNPFHMDEYGCCLGIFDDGTKPSTGGNNTNLYYQWKKECIQLYNIAFNEYCAKFNYDPEDDIDYMFREYLSSNNIFISEFATYLLNHHTERFDKYGRTTVWRSNIDYNQIRS